ncbi:MAG TPA: pitrilysin family protein [Acetobacteraceae bacterium]|nr:pitrilysin family protein [Acetobacteraceae bacterium]
MSGRFSIPIQVVRNGPVEAWLVRDDSLPVVSLAWSWRGGAALEPAEHGGATAMAGALLTEGAGDLRSEAFADALRNEGIQLSFSAGRDEFQGGFRTLKDSLPEAVRLARLAMTAPRLDPPAVERVRARAVAAARTQLETPRGVAGRAFWAEAYPDHPAGRPTSGTAETLAALPVEAIRAAIGRQLRHDGMIVAAAGAIGPDELARLMETLFAGLPPGAPETPPPLPPFTQFGRKVISVAAPQSQVVFGQPGIAVQDPDWEAAQVVMRVLAGGGFSSRLMEAVRVQRGLTYGIGAGLDALFRQGVIVGSVATENARVGETLAVTREEWVRMATGGPTQDERDEAVAYLTGSLPLQFSDTQRIAGMLLALRRNERPIDWLERRPERLAALTRERLTEVSRRLLRPEALSAAIAGEPQGL